MGVRGASQSNSHYQARSPTSCMKSLPYASAPASPHARDALSPSQTSSPALTQKPQHPIPPPLQLPAPPLPSERAPPPLLSSTFVSPATVPTPSQLPNARLNQQNSSSVFGHTLLTVSSKPEAPPQPARPLSARLSQKAQEPVPPTPDSPDDLDNIEIRFYPFPPPRHPLTYPLPTSASSFSSKPPAKHGVRAQVHEKAGIRKRLLARWRREQATQTLSPLHRSQGDLPSDELRRTESATTSAKRKRARTCYQDNDLDGQQKMAKFTSDTNGDGLRGKRAQSTQEAGNDVLSVSPSPDQVGNTVPQLTTKTKAYSSESQLGGRLPATQPEGGVNAHREFPSTSNGDGNRCQASKNNSPRNVQSRQSMVTASSPMPSHAQLYAKSNGQLNASNLQQLQHQIDVLKQHRKRLEDSQFKEISRKASEMFSDSATKEQRLRLKSDIEGLSPRAIRDMLLHISRRCTEFQVIDHDEVQLQIDLLPAELVGELRLIVMKDKGQIEFAGHSELQKVRTKLWNCLEEYRRMLSSLDNSEPK